MTRASSLRPSTTATARGTPGLPNLRTCPVWRKIVSVNASPKHLKKPAPPDSTEAATKASAQKAGQTPTQPAPAWAQAKVDGLNRAPPAKEGTTPDTHGSRASVPHWQPCTAAGIYSPARQRVGAGRGRSGR